MGKSRGQPTPIIQATAPKTDDLASEKGINYTRLRDLLAAKNWKEADKETYRVMIQAVGKKDGDSFDKDKLLNFPCTDLRTIDRLWVKYSNGHFGFSVQKEIYLSVGGKADGRYYEEAWKKFGDRVGWRVESSWIFYSKVTVDTSSPRGNLPIFYSGKLSFSHSVVISSLASRLVNCNTP
ncbi:GUN4 domain-containing protein [Nostoc sp. HG1]|nr:GUN4 domain-containing protein [Nostoc sp. HG1]